jgi:hypothetical protein
MRCGILVIFSCDGHQISLIATCAITRVFLTWPVVRSTEYLLQWYHVRAERDGKLFYSPYHAVPIGLRVFFIYCLQQEGTAMSRAPSYFFRNFCRDFYCEHSNITVPRAGEKNRTNGCDHHSLGFCFHVTARLSLRCDAEQITRLHRPSQRRY